jgi:hypothetical protein
LEKRLKKWGFRLRRKYNKARQRDPFFVALCSTTNGRLLAALRVIIKFRGYMRVLILLIALAISGCANQHTFNRTVTESKPSVSISEEERWLFMVGKWYGSLPTKDGGVRQQIVERYPNGSYKITFKVIDSKGKSEESSEVGNWGISGPIYFTIFRGWLYSTGIEQADPSSPYNYDAYNIVSLTSDLFEYSHVTSGNKYKIQKVGPDFEFPE